MVVVLAVCQLHLVVLIGFAVQWRLARLGFTPLTLHIGHDIQGRGRPQRLPVGILYAEDPLVVGVDHQPHGASGQLVRELEARSLVGDGAVLTHFAPDTMVEQLVEPSGQAPQGTQSRQIPLIARQGGLSFKATMGRLVIDCFEPGPQAGVEIAQIADTGGIELAYFPFPSGA